MRDETEVRESGDEPAEGQAAEAPSAASAGNADPDGADGAGPAGEGQEVGREVEELREELETLNDQHLRLAAEFNNYRKRNERERGALATRLQADLVASLLDVLDDLERVAESGEDASADAVLEGVRMVEKKFMTVLQAAGLEPIEAEGQAFDPEVMEALMTVPSGDPEQDHKVADVFQRGYRFRDTMVRPARVRVWQYDESQASE